MKKEGNRVCTEEFCEPVKRNGSSEDKENKRGNFVSHCIY